MTTIIWKKLSDWTLVLASDKRITQFWWIYLDQATKIVTLDDKILLWKAWDSISNKLTLELYNEWKDKFPNWITSILESINFYNFVKKNCNIYNINTEEWKPNVSFLVFSKDFQIQIDNNWQVTELKKDWILTIWSWATIATILHSISKESKFKVDLLFEDYFNVISSLDINTSKEFETLFIK